jgi:hypothetical protein
MGEVPIVHSSGETNFLEMKIAAQIRRTINSQVFCCKTRRQKVRKNKIPRNTQNTIQAYPEGLKVVRSFEEGGGVPEEAETSPFRRIGGPGTEMT